MPKVIDTPVWQPWLSAEYDVIERERKIATFAALNAGAARAEDGAALMLSPEQLRRLLAAAITGRLIVVWQDGEPVSVTLED